MRVDVSPTFRAFQQPQQDLALVGAYAIVVRHPDKLYLHLGSASEWPRTVTDCVAPVVTAAGHEKVPRKMSVSAADWMEAELNGVLHDAMSLGVLGENVPWHVSERTNWCGHHLSASL